ncbi:B-cell lymphoma 3 protein homolog isoform X1 [Hemitrygon akajei]|uniref:B-cell lymphoma 3 protein homolog isoform X1 n=1 Tax=Hemitrygon akajei TaxID=2704970 RepID=UPI003BF9F47A
MKLEEPGMEERTHTAPLDLRTQRVGWGCGPTPEGRPPPAKKERPSLSLPPRKRPYPREGGRSEIPPGGVCRGEGSSCPLPTTPCLEHVYLPFGLPHLPYFPAAYYPAQLPLCPLPTHPPLGISGLAGLHSPACSLLLPPQGDPLASDIAVATRQDEDGDTPLHIAVAQGDVHMVQRLVHLLLVGKKSLDIYNNLRQTPLHLAVITRHAGLTAVLVTGGASPVLLDRNGQSAIHLACEHRCLSCLRSLLGQAQGKGRGAADLDIRNYEGYTPLHIAVNNQDHEILTFLLDQGADIDAVDIKSGRTALIHAVENDCRDLVQLLLEHGASVNLQTYSGNTALHSASGRGLMDIVKVLLKNGADTSIKNCHNDTSLTVAKNKKVVDVLRGKASRLPSQPGSIPMGTSELSAPSSPNKSPLEGATGSSPASPCRPRPPSGSSPIALGLPGSPSPRAGEGGPSKHWTLPVVDGLPPPTTLLTGVYLPSQAWGLTGSGACEGLRSAHPQEHSWGDEPGRAHAGVVWTAHHSEPGGSCTGRPGC